MCLNIGNSEENLGERSASFNICTINGAELISRITTIKFDHSVSNLMNFAILTLSKYRKKGNKKGKLD